MMQIELVASIACREQEYLLVVMFNSHVCNVCFNFERQSRLINLIIRIIFYPTELNIIMDSE